MTISALPDAPSQGGSVVTFNSKAYAFVAALNTFGSEANGLISTMNGYASAASGSASTASGHASDALASANAAAASYDSFDDRYLGPKASAPSVDNDGNALLTGALYFDTTAGGMKVWSGSTWLSVDPNAIDGGSY